MLVTTTNINFLFVILIFYKCTLSSLYSLFYLNVNTNLSCFSNEAIAPTEASFLGLSSGTYNILDDPNSQFKIPIGLTSISNEDRTVNVLVSSPTGAQQGVQYTLSATTVTIPAGSSIDSLTVKGIFAGYEDGHVDTLVFAITGGSVPGLTTDSTFTLILQKSCPYDVNNFSGEMEVITDEWADYSPGDIIPVTKIDDNHVSFEYAAYDARPIIIAIDPVNFTTSVTKQVYGNYGTPPAWTYGDISAQSVPGSSNNFIDPCNKVISVELSHSVAAGGFGSSTITLKKVE